MEGQYLPLTNHQAIKIVSGEKMGPRTTRRNPSAAARLPFPAISAKRPDALCTMVLQTCRSAS